MNTILKQIIKQKNGRESKYNKTILKIFTILNY